MMENFSQHTNSKEECDPVEKRPASTVTDIAEQKRKRFSKSRDERDEGIIVERKARKRLLVQRSLSLPDVVPVTCTSPVFDESPPSPDILCRGTRNEKKFEDKKLELEGPVYKPSRPRPKSVSFLDESNENISVHGKVRRQQLREKKSSSGYWTGGSGESSISVDGYSFENAKKQDVDTGTIFENVQPVTDNNGAASKPGISDGIPTISLFTFNSSGSVYVNEEIVRQLERYDTGLAPSSRTPQSSESVSPLSKFCYDKLSEEKNESVTESKLDQPSILEIRKEEGKLKKELYHGEFERQMLSNNVSNEKIFSFSESTTPSPHDFVNNYCKEDKDKNPASLQQPKSLDIYGKGECLRDTNLPETLEKYCNCYNKVRCGDKKCKEIQSAIDELRSCIDNQIIPTSTNICQILLALRVHSLECKNDICPIPWCNALSQLNEWSVKHAITALCDSESTLTGGKTLQNCISICKEYKYGYKEGIDWFSLMPLNKKKNVIIAESLGTMNVKDTRCVIKKTNLNDYNQQLSVYKQLRKFISPYVVQHYWACECDSTELLICTRFLRGIPLSEILYELPNDDKEVCLWMCHIITGVLHLHRYGIIYLKWSSKNILFHSNDCLKITDLSCSVLSSLRQSEYHEIKQLLPPTIFPPEIDDIGAEINEKSDSWGCACLLYELCMSFPLFHHLCHERKEQIWKQMKSMPMPHLPKIWQTYQPILDSLWQKDTERRQSIETVLSKLYYMYKS